MRLAIFVLLFFTLVHTACDPSKKTTGKNADKNACSNLVKLEVENFNELSSDNYSLESVRQENGKLMAEVITTADISSYNLYWNGTTMKSQPPKANVKIVVDLADAVTSAKKQTLCFDLEKMMPSGQIYLYFLDDEETFLFEF